MTKEEMRASQGQKQKSYVIKAFFGWAVMMLGLWLEFELKNPFGAAIMYVGFAFGAWAILAGFVLWAKSTFLTDTNANDV